MARDTAGNVAVDYIWGNMPMQPNDDRGANTLDPALDNHIIATTSYNGFPGYNPGGAYLDTIANTTVPDVVGSTEADATTAIQGASLVASVTYDSYEADVSNDGTVKSQNPAAGSVTNVGSAVSVVVYQV